MAARSIDPPRRNGDTNSVPSVTNMVPANPAMTALLRVGRMCTSRDGDTSVPPGTDRRACATRPAWEMRHLRRLFPDNVMSRLHALQPGEERKTSARVRLVVENDEQSLVAAKHAPLTNLGHASCL